MARLVLNFFFKLYVCQEDRNVRDKVPSHILWPTAQMAGFGPEPSQDPRDPSGPPTCVTGVQILAFLGSWERELNQK